MGKKVLLAFIVLTCNVLGFSQNSNRNGIAAKSIDSTLVTFYPTSLDSISLIAPYYLDTATFHADNYDILERSSTLYSTLSNIGLAHKPMRFTTSPQIGFDLSIPALSNYIRTEKDLRSYLSLLPYSEIRYVMTSVDKEQHLNFRFGRQFLQGLFLSFEYNINFSPGIYTNNKADNNYFWINALYNTKDQRYRATAYWYRNKLDMQENGGIQYDSVYANHIESDNAAILTNLSNATNYVKVSGAGFQHHFNLLPQHKKTPATQPETTRIDSIRMDSIMMDSLRMDTIRTDSLIQPAPVIDSVSTRKFTLGRISHSFAYQRNQMFYNETSSSLPFYAPFDSILSPRTTDTTIVHAFHNSVTWNSLGYKKYSDNVPFYLYAGIDYDFFKIKHYDYFNPDTINDQKHSQVSINGGIIINLFRSTTLTGQVKLITLGYQIGDFDIKGRWRQYLGTTERNFGKLVFDFNMKRQSPTWFESDYHSNHFRWENDFHPATYLTFDLRYQFKSFHVGMKNTTINDLIYFNQEAHPEQYDGIVSISEAYGAFSQSLWRFKFEGFFCLNLVKGDVVHLPLFQSRLRIGYSQPMFKKAAILQPSITVQYFTKYYADAYMPALRTFYLQDDILVGNYPYIDLAIAINVKKADIFVKYSNMFLLTGNYDSFIAPHYPMRDSKIFFGVNWRLFN